MTSRTRMLVVFVAVLAVLRFIVVPWLHGQATAHDRLFTVTRQLDRAEAVAEIGPRILSRRDALRASVEDLGARAPAAGTGAEYRLRVQQELRSALEASGLEMTVFEWVLDGRDEPTGLAFGRVRIQVEGPLVDVARAHVGIEAGLPHAFVRALNVTVLRGGGGPNSGARATMELDLYYRGGGDA
ncbi:MAG: hypothetical protein P8172_05715 [Gammaproteobacteria bacterium]